MVYADAAGSVGQVVAAHLPHRPPAPEAMLTPPEPWGAIASTVPGQSRHDPAEGFIASANDRPDGATVGYFFAPPYRVERLRQLLGSDQPIDAAAMRALPLDVQLPGLPPLHAVLLPALRPRTAMQAATVQVLRDWTGRYDADSQGALAWELLLGHLVAGLRHRPDFARYSAIWTARALLAEDIARLPPAVLAPALGLALRRATAGLRRYGTWGAVHHMRAAHPFARLPFGGALCRTVRHGRRQRHVEQKRPRAGHRPARLYFRRLRAPCNRTWQTRTPTRSRCSAARMAGSAARPSPTRCRSGARAGS